MRLGGGGGSRRGALARPAILDYDDDDENDGRPTQNEEDDDEAPLDPDAPADLSAPSASSSLAPAAMRAASAPSLLLPHGLRRPSPGAFASSRRSLIGSDNNTSNNTPAPTGPLGRLKRAAAAKKAAAASAAAALAEQRAALQARMATAFALGADGQHQHHLQEKKQRSAAAAAAAATALAAVYAQGLGPGFGPPTEPGAFWRGLLHVVVTPAWALVLLLSWLCNQWQRLWRPLGGLFWWSVDLLDQRAPLLVDWALWLLGTLSLALHVAATAAALAAAAVTLQQFPSSLARHHPVPVGVNDGAASPMLVTAHGADVPIVGVVPENGTEVAATAAAAALVAPTAVATATTGARSLATTAAFLVLALYALTHYCTAAAMFRELDLRDQGGCYFSDLVAFLGRIVDVLLHDVQLCAAAVHGNRVLEAGAQLAFRGYEEARVAAGALLFTAPSALVLGYVHYYRGGAALATAGSAADVVEQLKEHLQQLGDLRALATYEGTLRAAVLLCAANTLEKLLRLSAVDPWAHDPGDGFPLLYVRSHAARLPGSLVCDWLFRCRLALADSGGRLALQDLFAYYTQQVRGGASSGLSDAHRAYLLRKAAHVFSLPRQQAARQRAEAAAAAGVDETALTPEDVAAAPEAYDPGARRATLASAPLVAVVGGAAGAAANKAAAAASSPSLRPLPDGDDDENGAGDGNDISHARSAAAAAAKAAAARRRQGVALRHLAADGLRPGPKLSRMLAEVLADASYVHTVSLASNSLEDGAVAAVVAACFGCGGGAAGARGGVGGGGDGDGSSSNGGNPDLALAHLDLSGNRVGPAGAASLARALCGPVGSRLRTLVLAGNPLRDEGAAALAEALRRGGGGGGGNGANNNNSSSPFFPLMLERLDLSDTGIGAEGGIALGHALRHNSRLCWLSVAGSRVGAVGVEAIAKSLARAGGRSGLLELDVSRTAADDCSAAAIAGMLAATGCPLRALTMRGTGVTDAGAQLICAALEGNATLRFIDVADSPLMDASWGRLLSHVLKGGGGGAVGGGGGGGGGGGAGGEAVL